jgi:hypothetical protein
MPIYKPYASKPIDTVSVDGYGEATCTFTLRTSNPSLLNLPTSSSAAIYDLMEHKVIFLKHEMRLDSSLKSQGYDLFFWGDIGGNFSVDILGNCYARAFYTNQIIMKSSGDDPTQMRYKKGAGRLVVDSEGDLYYYKYTDDSQLTGAPYWQLNVNKT